MKMETKDHAIGSPRQKAGHRMVNPRKSAINFLPSGPTCQRASNRGYMAVDILFGIIIVMSVTVTLLVTMRHVQSVERRLSDSRGALHLAEHALLNLQHDQALPTVPSGETLTIHRAGSGIAPAGYAWAKVDATVHGHAQSLLGVVPISAIPSTGGKP